MGVDRHGFTPIGTVTDERGYSRISRIFRNSSSVFVRVIRDTSDSCPSVTAERRRRGFGVDRHGFTPIGTVTDGRGYSRNSRIFRNSSSVFVRVIRDKSNSCPSVTAERRRRGWAWTVTDSRRSTVTDGRGYSRISRTFRNSSSVFVRVIRDKSNSCPSVTTERRRRGWAWTVTDSRRSERSRMDADSHGFQEFSEIPRPRCPCNP